MRPNTSMESGVCVMLMMALQEGHAPLASNVMTDLPDRVFPDKTHTAQVKALRAGAMSEAEDAYLDRLEDVHLSDLLDMDKADKGAVDWPAVASRKASGQET